MRPGLEGCWPGLEVIGLKEWLLQALGEAGLAGFCCWLLSQPPGSPGVLLINMCKGSESVGALSREGGNTVWFIVSSLVALDFKKGRWAVEQLLPGIQRE